jgi:hypothetical protein
MANNLLSPWSGRIGGGHFSLRGVNRQGDGFEKIFENAGARPSASPPRPACAMDAFLLSTVRVDNVVNTRSAAPLSESRIRVFDGMTNF